MQTFQEEAPFGGTELFTMEGKAVAYQPLASNFDWKKIKEELVEMGESMNCDVEFSDVTGDSIRNWRGYLERMQQLLGCCSVVVETW